MTQRTQYLGFDLPNPFLVGASPLVYNIGMVKLLEDSGAAAVVMHSLFEEQIIRENVRGFPDFGEPGKGIFPESSRFPLHPEAYLKHIAKLKEAVDIPVIASLNGIHIGTWVDYARLIEDAGADALELNLYFTPRSDMDPSHEIESSALEIVRTVYENIGLPLAVKIGPFYTGLPRFVSRLEEAGAKAVILFNSFFQPAIDVESITYKTADSLFEPHALLLRTRWIATLHGRTGLDLCLSGGVGQAEDAVKAVLAGATAVQVVTSLIQEGPGRLKDMIDGLSGWMKGHGFESLAQMRGLLSFKDASNTEELARAGYLKMLQSWNPED